MSGVTDKQGLSTEKIENVYPNSDIVERQMNVREKSAPININLAILTNKQVLRLLGERQWIS